MHSTFRGFDLEKGKDLKENIYPLVRSFRRGTRSKDASIQRYDVGF